ncbi:MAG: cytochrome P460 family protein [Candidatus Deferrimicrobiaceae bacterium]
MRRPIFLTIRILGTFVLSLALLLPIPGDAGSELASPTFGVTVPEGYRQWPVVAPSHRTDMDEIRVILGNDIAMKAYRAGTLPFPDGAILAKLAWKRVKSAEFAETFVPGEPQRIEFMVKNAKKYASTGGWGFGRFVNGKPADENQHATCFPCHLANVKGHDFVFTRYAP